MPRRAVRRRRTPPRTRAPSPPRSPGPKRCHRMLAHPFAELGAAPRPGRPAGALPMGTSAPPCQSPKVYSAPERTAPRPRRAARTSARRSTSLGLALPFVPEAPAAGLCHVRAIEALAQHQPSGRAAAAPARSARRSAGAAEGKRAPPVPQPAGRAASNQRASSALRPHKRQRAQVAARRGRAHRRGRGGRQSCRGPAFAPGGFALEPLLQALRSSGLPSSLARSARRRARPRHPRARAPRGTRPRYRRPSPENSALPAACCETSCTRAPSYFHSARNSAGAIASTSAPGDGLRAHERGGTPARRHAGGLRRPAPEPGEQLRIGRRLRAPNLLDCGGVHARRTPPAPA